MCLGQYVSEECRTQRTIVKVMLGVSMQARIEETSQHEECVSLSAIYISTHSVN